MARAFCSFSSSSRLFSMRSRSTATTSGFARLTKLGLPNFRSLASRSFCTFAMFLSSRARSSSISMRSANGTTSSTPSATPMAQGAGFCALESATVMASTLASWRMADARSETIFRFSCSSQSAIICGMALLGAILASPRMFRIADTMAMSVCVLSACSRL